MRACLLRKNPEYGEIISWNEDGKAFKVKKPNEFAEKVLPKYFKTNNFASFVRQVISQSAFQPASRQAEKASFVIEYLSFNSSLLSCS